MADGLGHKTFKGSREVDLNTRPAHPGRNSKFEWQSQFRAVRQPPKAQDARGSTASCFLLWAGSVHACFHLASIVGLFNPLIAPLATRKTPGVAVKLVHVARGSLRCWPPLLVRCCRQKAVKFSNRNSNINCQLQSLRQ